MVLGGRAVALGPGVDRPFEGRLRGGPCDVGDLCRGEGLAAPDERIDVDARGVDVAPPDRGPRPVVGGPTGDVVEPARACERGIERASRCSWRRRAAASRPAERGHHLEQLVGDAGRGRVRACSRRDLLDLVDEDEDASRPERSRSKRRAARLRRPCRRRPTSWAGIVSTNGHPSRPAIAARTCVLPVPGGPNSTTAAAAHHAVPRAISGVRRGAGPRARSDPSRAHAAGRSHSRAGSTARRGPRAGPPAPTRPTRSCRSTPPRAVG